MLRLTHDPPHAGTLGTFHSMIANDDGATGNDLAGLSTFAGRTAAGLFLST